MAKILLSVLLSAGLSQAAFGQEWEEKVANMSALELSVTWTQQLAAKIMACGAGNTIVGVSIVADTVPVTNILSEIAANMADENYQSLSSEDWLGQFGDIFKGTFAGAGALIKDSAQFVILVLAGEEEKAWQSVEKAYSSSITLAQKFDQEGSLCSRVRRAEAIVRNELMLRWGGNSVKMPPPANVPMIFHR